MPINISNLQTELETNISALSNTVTADELLLITNSVKEFGDDRIPSVANTDALPLLYENDEVIFPSGQILYVEEFGVPVISVTSRWLGLDGRVLRDDNLVSILYGWGFGLLGQLGTGDQIDRSSPVTVTGGITNWSSVAAGYRHSLAVTNTGELYSWGVGFNGRLGTNDTITRSSPVTVVGGITNWSSVAAGGRHSLGITDTGLLYAWGSNGFGRMGTGDETSRNSPVTVTGGITNWSSVAAGDEHSLGLTDTGVLYAWGRGLYGRLGTGDITNKSSPVTVAGGLTNWSSIATNNFHSLGLTDTGVLYAWGEGKYGRLGTEDEIDRSSPVTVTGGITNWSSIDAGYSHSLGVTDTGLLYAWGGGGWQNDGKLGTNDTIDRSSPVTVTGGITNWSSVAAGKHSLGLTDTGVLYAWGFGLNGVTGTNDVTKKSSPTTVVGGITNWSSIDANSGHSLAINTYSGT